MASFEYEPYFPIEHKEPFEIISLDGSLYKLTPENTQLRFFEETDGKFDHILLKINRPENTPDLKFLFVDDIEEIDPELVDRLRDKDFPVESESIPDAITVDAYTRWSTWQWEDGISANQDE